LEAANLHDQTDDTLYLGLHAGKNFGWGICSQYLIQELSGLTKVQVLETGGDSADAMHLPGKLFMGLADEDFYPLFENVRGVENYAYTFFENVLSDVSVNNARRYRKVLAGSTWCRDRMIEKGIDNCGILLQGIDPQKFYPVEAKRNTDQFVIFSGGKFELRKGQDLVLKAFKLLQDKYKDIVLVNCWYNFWPHSIATMNASCHINMDSFNRHNWSQSLQRVYAINGLKAERIKTLEIVPNYILREIYRQTDIGVFPNRCEGGTNLVLMEYMACGKPVIATYASGHKDVLNANNALLLNDLQKIKWLNQNNKTFAQWKEPSLDELVDRIEFAYHHRDDIQAIGDRAGEDMKGFTWAESARSLMRSLGIKERAHGAVQA
jgi:glycosyltransferase involved in cell wall biosynthesis